MSETFAIWFVAAPVCALLAVIFAVVGLLQGQWLGASLRGYGVEFRRNLVAFIQRNPRTRFIAGGLWFFAIAALVYPVANMLTSGFDVRIVVLWQTVITLGIVVGIIAGIATANPVNRKAVLAVAVIGALLTWLLVVRASGIPEFAAYGMYGFVLIVSLVNGVRFLRSNAAKPDMPVTRLDDLRLDSARDMAAKLLLDGGAIMERSPLGCEKIHDADLEGFAQSVMACVSDREIAIGIPDGFTAENFEPTLPGGETVLPRIMWIAILTESIEFVKSEKLIGYAETSYRIKPSGLRLTINGRPARKQWIGKLAVADG